MSTNFNDHVMQYEIALKKNLNNLLVQFAKMALTLLHNQFLPVWVSPKKKKKKCC